jgi:hypothetical protein
MDSGTYTSLQAKPLTEETLTEAMERWKEMLPRVCCAACRKEGSWLEIDRHWSFFRDGEHVYRLAECLAHRTDGLRFYERVPPEFRR